MYYRAFFAVAFVALCASAYGQKSAGRNNVGNTADESTDFETSVIAEINLARTNPADYSKKIVDRKSKVNGRIMRLANRQPFLMIEGIPAIDGAISEMKKTPERSELIHSSGLHKAARSQLKDLQENPRLGHYGKDGNDLNRRLSRYGHVEFAGENISHWDLTPEQVVLTMLIDDGVASRQHRINLLNSRFSLIGVGCGKGKESRFICVVVFVNQFDKPKKAVRSY